MADEGTSAEVTAAIRALGRSIESVQLDITDVKINQQNTLRELASLTTAHQNLNQDMDGLCKVVRDGNGQPSMLHRIAQAETTLVTHHDEIEKLRRHYNAATSAKTLSRGQIITGLLGVTATILLALGSMLVALFR